mmetsp:Transcript_42873/g.91149  ORF Transcript_42873/g.91149 Transcript_42873/m.91149 type:complete len:114 (+) Transcript_42873:1232-1573(+)
MPRLQPTTGLLQRTLRSDWAKRRQKEPHFGVNPQGILLALPARENRDPSKVGFSPRNENSHPTSELFGFILGVLPSLSHILAVKRVSEQHGMKWTELAGVKTIRVTRYPGDGA